MATEKIIKKLYGNEVEVTFYPNSHRYQLKGEKSFLISATAMTGILDKSRFLIPWAVGLAGAHIRQFIEGRTNLSCEELTPVIEEALKQHEIKKEEAGGYGKQIHDWCERFARSKSPDANMIEAIEPPITEDMPEQVLNGINAFLEFYNSHDVKFLETERLTYSKNFGWVGITDAVALVDGKKTVIDYKTGKYIYDEQYLQLGQYWISLNEEYEHLRKKKSKTNCDPIEQGMILHFGKENGEFTVGHLPLEEHSKNVETIIALHTIKRRLKELEAKKYK